MTTPTPPPPPTDLPSWAHDAWRFGAEVWSGFADATAFEKAQALLPVVSIALAFLAFLFRNTIWRLISGRGAKKPSTQALTRALCAKLPKKTKTDGLSVLVFELDGDDTRASRTNGVETSTAEAFSGHAEIHRAGFTIAIGKSGSREDRMAAARELVAHALEKSGHDGALWGDVVLDRDVVNFVIQTRGAVHEGGLSSHKLDDTLRLPPTALGGIGPLVAARLSAECAPAYEGGKYVADILAPAVKRLEQLLASAPAWLTGDAKGKAWFNLGVALSTLGEQTGQNQPLERSIASFYQTLEEWTRERVPLDWAMTQNNLGNALTRLGERESGNARLEEAAAAYYEALKEWTRERAPLDWATTQNNLGNVLRTLGEREGGTARLEEAVAAHREALKEWTRKRVPLQWAGTQNNLGNALLVLGERESGTARLEEAVTAYREALKECTREHVPLQWAMTQNNLGSALQALGGRESGTARLEEAVSAYRETLKEWTRERVPLDWAMTQNNLGTALQVLGERESGTARLEEAVATFHEALKERTRERVPLQWATTQDNLGNALSALSERETGNARLEEAVAAYREALKERLRERVPLDWAITQNNIGTAEELFGDKFEGETARAHYQAAAAAFEAAREVFREAGASAYIDFAERNLARVRGKLSGT